MLRDDKGGVVGKLKDLTSGNWVNPRATDPMQEGGCFFVCFELCSHAPSPPQPTFACLPLRPSQTTSTT